MSHISLPIFETTVQKTDLWLKEIMEKLGWSDRHKAYIALKGVLHMLRDRLPVDVAAKFGAELPMLIRGFYYEGWSPAKTPIKSHNLTEFLDQVYLHLANASFAQERESMEEIVRPIFHVIQNQLSKGEIEHLRKVLPASIAALWDPV